MSEQTTTPEILTNTDPNPYEKGEPTREELARDLAYSDPRVILAADTERAATEEYAALVTLPMSELMDLAATRVMLYTTNNWFDEEDVKLYDGQPAPALLTRSLVSPEAEADAENRIFAAFEAQFKS